MYPEDADQGPPAGSEGAVIKELSLPLWQAKGWLKLIGVLAIIEGVLLIPTLVGILICWLPIWMGILLLRTSGAVEIAQLNGDRVQMMEAQNKLKIFFTISGILALVGILLTAVLLVIALVAGGGILRYLTDLQ